MAKKTLYDSIRAIPEKYSPPTALNPNRVCWSPSINPLVKVNFDGAVFKESREAGLGWFFEILRAWFWRLRKRNTLTPLSCR